MTNIVALRRASGFSGRDVTMIRQHFARGVLDGTVEVESALGDQEGIEAVHVASAGGEPIVSFGGADGCYHAVGASEAGRVLGAAATIRRLLAV